MEQWLLQCTITGLWAIKMFIHEMTQAECRNALERATLGRLACARDNQPYVVPINFASDGIHLYGFTTLGQKVEWMRANPLVCFEMDERNNGEWVSIVVFGRYEELADTPEHAAARLLGHELLRKRAMWWEPAYVAQNHRDQPHSLTPIFFRVLIDKITGHRITPNEVSEPVRSTRKQGWLGRLLGE